MAHGAPKNTRRNTRTIRSLSRLELPGGGQVRLRGNLCFVGHLSPPYGTTILDVSDPRDPKILSQIMLEDDRSHSHKVRVTGDLIRCRHASRRTRTSF